MITTTAAITLVIAISTWLTPMPEVTAGKALVYGSQRLVEANAEFRGYDLAPYKDRCGVSVMSPADLGKIVWLKTTGDWYGPCLAVDVAKRTDFVRLVTEIGDVVEVPRPVFKALGATDKQPLKIIVSVGQCPKRGDPQAYTLDKIEMVPLEWGHASFYPYPKQEMPMNCVASKVRSRP